MLLLDIIEKDIIMSKMKSYMMDVEDFCNGYFYGGDSEFTIDEVIDEVDKYFESTIESEYAEKYLESILGK